MSTSDPELASKKIKYIVITHGDSYLGQAMAMHLAAELERVPDQLKSKHRIIRVLCKEKGKLKHLERRGIEVREVDYESVHTIRNQLGVHVKTMIFNPFVSVSGRMVECGRYLLDAALEENVKRTLMISSYGVDDVEKSAAGSPIAQFHQLEHHLRTCCNYGGWVIYRIPFIQQYMYFWKLMIENKNMLGLPISRTDMLQTVNVKDVLACVAMTSLSKKCRVWGYPRKISMIHSTILPPRLEPHEAKQRLDAIKRVYELVSEPTSLTLMAGSMTHALRNVGSGADIEPAVLSDEQLENYLKMVAKTDKADSPVDRGLLNSILADVTPTKGPSKPLRSSENDGIAPVGKSLASNKAPSRSSDHQDSPDLYPCPADTLTRFRIQLILDHFKVARNANAPVVPNNDIRSITGRAPIPIDMFFMVNRRLFRSE